MYTTSSEAAYGPRSPRHGPSQAPAGRGGGAALTVLDTQLAELDAQAVTTGLNQAQIARRDALLSRRNALLGNGNGGPPAQPQPQPSRQLVYPPRLNEPPPEPDNYGPGQGPGPGPGYDQGPGYAPGQATIKGPGMRPAQATIKGPGSGYRPGPGYDQGPGYDKGYGPPGGVDPARNDMLRRQMEFARQMQSELDQNEGMARAPTPVYLESAKSDAELAKKRAYRAELEAQIRERAERERREREAERLAGIRAANSWHGQGQLDDHDRSNHREAERRHLAELEQQAAERRARLAAERRADEMEDRMLRAQAEKPQAVVAPAPDLPFFAGVDDADAKRRRAHEEHQRALLMQIEEKKAREAAEKERLKHEEEAQMRKIEEERRRQQEADEAEARRQAQLREEAQAQAEAAARRREEEKARDEARAAEEARRDADERERAEEARRRDAEDERERERERERKREAAEEARRHDAEERERAERAEREATAPLRDDDSHERMQARRRMDAEVARAQAEAEAAERAAEHRRFSPQGSSVPDNYDDNDEYIDRHPPVHHDPAHLHRRHASHSYRREVHYAMPSPPAPVSMPMMPDPNIERLLRENAVTQERMRHQEAILARLEQKLETVSDRYEDAQEELARLRFDAARAVSESTNKTANKDGVGGVNAERGRILAEFANIRRDMGSRAEWEDEVDQYTESDLAVKQRIILRCQKEELLRLRNKTREAGSHRAVSGTYPVDPPVTESLISESTWVPLEGGSATPLVRNQTVPPATTVVPLRYARGVSSPDTPVTPAGSSTRTQTVAFAVGSHETVDIDEIYRRNQQRLRRLEQLESEMALEGESVYYM
ncbi:uncharacterized protein AMSG_03562 [Thecamonas trahens ATCC 50062]|uniref:Uncharacterized protein n=1 Tax=Thecamonas trahens ATCC 50062 TaxID=461836 RepID=A0A0L0D765_THETB|nr:hypothetical protein AMSG_03562 [Thecamonas trahens ATCC 50062]KNC47133.1 hypothetical protein AMSG_03562 [Thecamonas trahens ATCC 50062]|eukprot:XP_013759909.1 hypothetical protein AMSG_03562 [Thecamonas trahens ATCC 50062]